jgi:hypothetical protein
MAYWGCVLLRRHSKSPAMIPVASKLDVSACRPRVAYIKTFILFLVKMPAATS